MTEQEELEQLELELLELELAELDATPVEPEPVDTTPDVAPMTGMKQALGNEQLSPMEAQAKRLEEINLEKGRVEESTAPVPYQEKEDLVVNALAGFGERAGDLGSGLLRAGEDVNDWLNSKLGEVVIGGDDGLVKYYSPEDIASGKMEGKVQPLLKGGADYAEDLDLGFEAQTSTANIKDVDGVWNTLKETGAFIVEQGIVSGPDMVALISTAPAYLVSRTSELSYDRAENNGRDKPSAEDRAIGSVTGLLVFAMDKFGLNALQAKDMAGKMLSNIGEKLSVELGTETVQEVLEYTGTFAGTDKGFKSVDAAEAGFGGALGSIGPAVAVAVPTPKTLLPTMGRDFSNTVRANISEKVDRLLQERDVEITDETQGMLDEASAEMDEINRQNLELDNVIAGTGEVDTNVPPVVPQETPPATQVEVDITPTPTPEVVLEESTATPTTVEEAAVITEASVDQAKASEQKLKQQVAEDKAVDALLESKKDPASVEKSKAADAAIDNLQVVESKIVAEQNSKRLKDLEKKAKEADFKKGDTVKVGRSEATVMDYNPVDDKYLVQKVDSKGKDIGEPQWVAKDKVKAVKQEKDTPTGAELDEDVKQADTTIDEAFSKVTPVVEEEVEVEAPPKQETPPPKAPPVTDTKVLTAEERVYDRLLERGVVYSGYEGGFLDDDANPVVLSKTQQDVWFDNNPTVERPAEVEKVEKKAPTKPLIDVPSGYFDEQLDREMNAEEAFGKLVERKEKVDELRACINA